MLSRFAAIFPGFAASFAASFSVAAPPAPCRVEVVEKGSGWPVPLVELRTTHGLRHVTDNAGLVALDAPDLLGRETWLTVQGHGYEVPKDGFGYRGVRFTPQAGGTHRIEVNRTIVAKRLGRLTGGGLFAESQKLGLETEWKDTDILGCDSIQLAEHRGKLFWMWGDTTVARYPLGIFDMSGATTPPNGFPCDKPPIRPAFTHFRDVDGRVRGIAKMPGDGPTWISGVVSLRDASGTPHLVCTYAKIEQPMNVYESGLAVWNDEAARYERKLVVWKKSEDSKKPPPVPDGHASFWTDEKGAEWLYFGDPLPRLRCRPTFESWSDPAQWEKVAPQPTLAGSDGSKVTPHSGSISWHPGRRKWVTVFMQNLGKPSAFGELWYAEAPAPTGPWGTAVKVLSHNDYTFYNPHLHPEMSTEKSLIFEGTYTREFSGNREPTPRYDYNQVLYRLDLDDPALNPAQQQP